MTQRHILLLTQQAELEAAFRSAVHNARRRVLNATNGDALGGHNCGAARIWSPLIWNFRPTS